jgi:TonB family protein
MSRLHQQRAMDPPAENARRELKFTVELEPRARNFFSNLAAVRPQKTRFVDLALQTPTASFWPDVFVRSGTPWTGLFQSIVCHLLFCFLIWNLTQTWLRTQPITLQRPFNSNSVIYYTVSDYLPPIESKGTLARHPRKGDPRRARQEIISVPPSADNDHQTIITPPNIKLNSDRRLPDIVAWTPVPSTVPLAGTIQTKLAVPTLPGAVIGPPPELSHNQMRRSPELPQPTPVAPAIDTSALTQSKAAAAPAPSVVEPAPLVEQVHKVGSVNIAQLQAQVEAPKVTITPQHTLPSATGKGQGGADQQLSSPAKSASTSSGKPTGRIIALNLDPAGPTGPLEVPEGNRRGIFATTPNGKEEASGTPDNKGGGTDSNGGGIGSADTKLAGITVSPGPAAPSSPVSAAITTPFPKPTRNLIASAMVPHNLHHLPSRTAPSPPFDLPETDARVFGAKKFYSMVLNMPNLNSAAGSWVIRFAELKATSPTGELTAPVATEKVDPEYPAELMRQRLEGTVTLYAVIRSDGTVADVRVLNGIDGRLDEFARAAIARWRFRPATKNGSAVDLEAVIHIPFQARRAY